MPKNSPKVLPLVDKSASYFETETERQKNHLTFIIVYCYNCSIYQLNFIMLQTHRRETLSAGFRTPCGFRQPSGELEWSQVRRTTALFVNILIYRR
jgi:hypothetical protein